MKFRNLRNLFYATFVFSVSIAMDGVANAATISGSMSEPFNYAPGTLFPNTGGTPNGGAGWNATGDGSQANTAGWGTNVQNNGNATGADRKATAGGLTFSATGYAAGTGNKLTLDSVTPASSESVSRTLGGQTIDAGTTYFSFLMRREADTLRTLNMAFFSGTTEKLTFGQIGAAVSGVLTGSNGKVALIYNNSNPAGIRASTVDMGLNVTHLIVGRIDWNTGSIPNPTFDKVTAWVDPTDVTSEAAAAAAQFYSNSEFDLTSLTFLRPFSGNAAATTPVTPANIGSYDEIRLGGTWASVTSTPAVPEPGSVALVLIGLLVYSGSGLRRKTTV
jgi:hypothetical protein